MRGLGLIGGGAVGMMNVKAVERPMLRQTLELQRAEHERRLSEINDAIAALEAHPEVLGVLEKLSKLGY